MQFYAHNSHVRAVLLATGTITREPVAAGTPGIHSTQGSVQDTTPAEEAAMLSAQKATATGAGTFSNNCGMQQTADPVLGKQQVLLHTTLGAALEQQEPTTSAPQELSTPRALTIFCNGNTGVYLVARRAVQCLCQGCSMSRATDTHSDCWLVSPTEFERHSGMGSAKKWRSSIRVAHAGEPDVTLGRWLDAKGFAPRPQAAAAPAGQPAAAAVAVTAQNDNSAHEQQQAQEQCAQQVTQQQAQLKQPMLLHPQQQHADRDGQCQDQLSGSARQLGQLLAAHYKQQQTRVHSKQPQLQSVAETSQQQSVLTEDQPLCRSTPIEHQQRLKFGANLTQAAAAGEAEAERQLEAGNADGIAFLAPAASSNYAAATVAAAVAAACTKSAAEVVECLQPYKPALKATNSFPASSPASAAAAAASQAAAEAEQAAADASGKAYQHCQQAQQQRNSTAAAAEAALKQERAMPAPLQIPCPRDDTASVALEEAAAAAARGDDSLWLRSPVRRTPRSARGMLPTLDALAAGVGRSTGDAVQAAAADAYRRVANSTAGASDSAAHLAAGTAQQIAAVDGAAAAALSQCERTASAVVKADEELRVAAEDEVIQEEELVPIGPAHQADLPQLRPLPSPEAAAALLELRKAGRPGPCQAEALAVAIEEKARSDLLPRDAVEDVWERSNGALALERAQRHRKAPGWQAAFIDPLKPYSLTGGLPGGGGANGSGAQVGHNSPVDAGDDGSEGAVTATAAAAGAKGRKRGTGSKGEDSHESGFEQLLQQQGKRMRCGSSTAAAPYSNKARRGSSACLPCNCNDPHCPVNAAAAAQHATHQHPSGLPRGPAAGPLNNPVPTGWSQGSGLCKTPIGPQLLSWLLLTPASVHPASTANPLPALQTPMGSRAVSEVGAADMPTAAAAAKLEAQRSGADLSTDSPESTARDGTAAAAVQDAAATATVQAAAAARALAGQLLKQGPVHSGASSDTTTDKQPQQQQQVPGPQPRHVEASVHITPAGVAAETATAAAATTAPPATVMVNTHGVVEVRILLDGCIFTGQLREAGRMELARSRVAAALQPLSDCTIHDPAPLGTCCVLCHKPEAAGCHADQATAASGTGMSRLGLGPLMPVRIGHVEQQHGVAETQQQQQQQQGEVVWVHRQCALWSPEVYPDRLGTLLHLPGAVHRGRATRCSCCREYGATLKCADRSCLRQFHLACARQAGCTLVAEPYTVACPAHPARGPEPQNPSAPDQLMQNVGPEPKLRCRTSVRPGARLADDSAAASGGGGALHMMDVDTYDSDATPTERVAGRGPGLCTGGAVQAAVEALECDDDDMSAAALLLSGFKKTTRGGQSRLRRQSNSQDFANNHAQHRQHSPDEISHDHATPRCAEHGTPPASATAAAARHVRGGGSQGGGSRSSRGNSAATAAAATAAAAKLSAGTRQMKDSRGRFMSHAAAGTARRGGCSGSGMGKGSACRAPPAAAAADHLAGASAGNSPWLSGQAGPDTLEHQAGPDSSLAQLDLPLAATAALGRISEDGGGSEVSGGTPLVDHDGKTTFELGGTTGQPGRAGRCAVCVIQRKGKCGTESAPKRCLRRQLMQQQKQKSMALVAAAAAAAAMQVQNEHRQQQQQGVPAAVAAAAEAVAHVHTSQQQHLQQQCAEAKIVAAAAATQGMIAADEQKCKQTPLVERNSSAAAIFAQALQNNALAQ